VRPRPSNREGFVLSVSQNPEYSPDWDSFPFTLPIARKLGVLKLHRAVTFLIGENGSGKSTFLEAIAVRMDFNETGGEANGNFGVRPVDGGLHDGISLLRSNFRRPGDCFFMRAETVFDFATQLDRDAVDDLRLLRRYGNRSLHARSHGEAFLAIVQNRLKKESFFLLDEPEAALSPNRQLTVLKEIDWLVRAGCQFVIATHSPILMSYPDSLMYELGPDGFKPTTWQETEHFQLTKSFLDHPDAFLRHLIE